MNNSSGQPSFSLAIILLSWDDLDGTLAVLEYLAGQMPDQSAVWIVDNGSKVPVAIPQSFAFSIHVIRSEANRGFAGGNNLALKAILKYQVAYLLLLNTDAHFNRGDLDSMYNYALIHPEIDILGPVIIEGSKSYYGGLDPALHLNTRRTQPGELTYVPGTAFLCKTEVFSRIGLLDENFFFSGEIADFCQRAKDAGYVIELIPSIKAQHEVETRSRYRNTLYLYYNIRNRFLYIRKHHSDQKVRLFLVWIFRVVRLALGALFTAQPARARAVWLALVDGLTNKFGNRNGRFI